MSADSNSIGLDLRFDAVPHVQLRGVGLEIEFADRNGAQTWKPQLRPLADGWESRSDLFGLVVRCRIAPNAAGGHILAIELGNEGLNPILLHRLSPLVVDTGGSIQIGKDVAHWSVYRQGYQSWTGTRSFRSREVDRDPWPHPVAVSLIDIHNPSPEQPGTFHSDTFAAIKNLSSGETLVAGFLRNQSAFGGIQVHLDGDRCARFAATLDYDGIHIPPGTVIHASPLWITAGVDEHELITAYMDAVAGEMNARVPEHSPVGWCSWYYYFTDIDEERICENLQALKGLRERFHCDYFQVDDGYQAEIGDWTIANKKFPRGMAWIASQIREAGFDAGIWTAPFLAKPESQLMREHPDWFVKTRRNQPVFALWNPLWGVRSSCYALDTTHPEVLDWLRRTFHTIVQEWGYRALKLDFLYAAALPGRRYDPGATRAAALRRGLEAIREGAGDDAFLLGCGCPLSPAVGIVDAMRIGPDVSPWWTNVFSRTVQRNLHGLATLHAIRNTLTRAYSHRRWWLNDPDCLMIRDTNTALTDDEVQTLATAIAVTDGMVVLSDRLEQLSPARLSLFDRTLALTGGTARIADLMEADVPELVVSRSSKQVVVAVFNFSDQAQPKRVSLSAAGVAEQIEGPLKEWWTGSPLTLQNGQVDFGIVPAHGCRVLVVPTSKGIL